MTGGESKYFLCCSWRLSVLKSMLHAYQYRFNGWRGLLAASILIVVSGHGYAAPPQAKVVDISAYGAVGDGRNDDSTSLQRALTFCSRNDAICLVPAGRNFRVTKPLFIWGGAILRGVETSGTITFDVVAGSYLLNVGIQGRNTLAEPFVGAIEGLTFQVRGGKEGRVIYLWRTRGARISGNIFDVAEYAYSATSSGNDNAWVVNGDENCIRENVRIENNLIKARSRQSGSEGIGIVAFDGAVISGNTVQGVGDDPIGIHYSKNVIVQGNKLESIDGRLFVSNSQNVEILNNHVARVASPVDGRFYEGIALVYLGFETFGNNDLPPISRIRVAGNELIYPVGAIDDGAAIYVYGPRDVGITGNVITNDSDLVRATGIHVLPTRMLGTWRDPTGRDKGNVARVHKVDILNNVSQGGRPMPFMMSGNCSEYEGPVTVSENRASAFSFYCGAQVEANSVVR